MSVNNKLDAALHYLSLGLSVFPVGNKKKPMVKWGSYQKELPTEDEVRSWWTKYPNANIAIVTGALSGVVVFDLDKKHDRSSKEFDIPLTASVRTGSGGEHFYFMHPGLRVRTNTEIFGLGVDMKGDGGFAIAPPSVNDAGGVYEWMTPFEDGVAEMPEWLSDVVIDKEE